MKSRIREIAESLGLGFVYVRRHEGNVVLDNEKFPIVVMYEVVDGEMEIVSNYVVSKTTYVIDVLQTVNMQDSADVNDSVFSLLRVYAAKIYKNIFEDGNYNFTGVVRWEKVKENEYDVNVIGIRMTMSVEEVIGSRCLYED